MCRLFCLAFTVALAVGCGSGIATAPVSGTITIDGEPLADASVTFTPKATGMEAPASNGRTDASGQYSLSVTATGDAGAVMGKHIVTVSLIAEEQEGDDADVIDPDDDASLPDHNFSFEVKAGDNVADFNLESGGGDSNDGGGTE